MIYTWHGATWWTSKHGDTYSPFTKTKTSIPNKTNQPSCPFRNVTGRKNRSSQPSQKQATHHPTTWHIRTLRVASRRSTLKNFWKAPCASMAQPSTLAFIVVQVVGRDFFWGGTRLCPWRKKLSLFDDKRVGLLRHLVCNYLGVEMSAWAERMRWWDLDFQGWPRGKGKSVGWNHDVRSPLLRLRQKWGLRFHTAKFHTWSSRRLAERYLWDLWDPSWTQIWTSKISFWFRFFFVALWKR